MSFKIGNWDELKIHKDGYTKETTRINGNTVKGLDNSVRPFHSQFMQTENISIVRNQTIETAAMLMGISSGLGHVFRFTENLFSDQGAVPQTGPVFNKTTIPSYFGGSFNYALTDVTYQLDFTGDWTLLALSTDDAGINYHTSVTTSDGRFWYDNVRVIGSVLSWGVTAGALVVQESGVGSHIFTELIALPYVITDKFAEAYGSIKSKYHPLPKYNVTVRGEEQVSSIDVVTNSTKVPDQYEIQLNLTTAGKSIIAVTPNPLASFSMGPESNRSSFPLTSSIEDSVGEDYASYETVGSVYSKGPGGDLTCPYMLTNARKLDLFGTTLPSVLKDATEVHIGMWINTSGTSLDTMQIFQMGSSLDYFKLISGPGYLQLTKHRAGFSTNLFIGLPSDQWVFLSFGFDTQLITDVTVTKDTTIYLSVNADTITEQPLSFFTETPITTTMTYMEAFDGTATGKFDGFGQNINFYRHRPSDVAIKSIYNLGKKGILI